VVEAVKDAIRSLTRPDVARRGSRGRPRRPAVAALLCLIGPAVFAQTFPFQDSFAAYGPGSTGAPYWSILSGRLVGGEKGLAGPVTLRLNSRPPRRFTVVMSVVTPPDAVASFGVYANVQHEKDVAACDELTVTGSSGSFEVSARGLGPAAFGSPTEARVSVPPSEATTFRFVVDGDTDRCLVFVGDQPGPPIPAEYGPGLLAFFLGENVRCTQFAVRAATAEELAPLAPRSIFSDPRDLASAGDGNLLVLHRGDRAVLAVSPAGEVALSFGRRMKGFLPDPVALAVGPQGNVHVLNRFPGEVTSFNKFGRVIGHIGAGRLKEPADLAILPDGSIFVADPAARRLVRFAPDGRWLKDITRFGDAEGTPFRVATGPLGNLVVALRDPDRTVVLQPLPDGGAALMSESPVLVYDVTVVEGSAAASTPAGIVRWPLVPAGPAFRSVSTGGLPADAKVATVGDHAWALDRTGARAVRVPRSLLDVQPQVRYADAGQVSAHVNWSSDVPAERSRVQVKRGDKWDTFTEGRPKDATDHHVLLVGLPAGQPFTYRVWPSVQTLPSSEWSREFTFDGAPATPAQAP
jgi:hypothetical protein